MLNKNYIIIALIVLCMVMAWLNINKEDVKPGKDFDALIIDLELQIDKQHRIILNQTVYSDSIIAINDSLDAKYDSLLNIEQQIIYIHDEEITTLPNASDYQLDSIIRSSW
tara:strand:- start:191 stop:523 length:333 start_codon:yes stop_codon:yes gene_type:complete